MSSRASLFVVCGALFVAGCGLKGPLYLPEKPQPVPSNEKDVDKDKKKSESPSSGQPPDPSATK